MNIQKSNKQIASGLLRIPRKARNDVLFGFYYLNKQMIHELLFLFKGIREGFAFECSFLLGQKRTKKPFTVEGIFNGILMPLKP